MIILPIIGVMTISSACRRAVDTAIENRQAVQFEFNGTVVTANPGVTAEELVKRWEDDYETKRKLYRMSRLVARRADLQQILDNYDKPEAIDKIMALPPLPIWD